MDFFKLEFYEISERLWYNTIEIIFLAKLKHKKLKTNSLGKKSRVQVELKNILLLHQFFNNLIKVFWHVPNLSGVANYIYIYIYMRIIYY